MGRFGADFLQFATVDVTGFITHIEEVTPYFEGAPRGPTLLVWR
ncbi:hypothetical protein [Paenibacillus sp. CECT 9249]|nr:hypothetical protein [Paenibacillus sp. CECT 9249]